MNRLPLRTLLFILTSLGLGNCSYQPHHPVVPLAAERHFATLSAMDQPVKVIVDTASRQVYYLSFAGEIYRMRPDGSGAQRIIGGVGATQEALFIQDFCVDSPNNRIVFTDLRDPHSGHSAIKQASLSGIRVRTLFLLDEVPYQVDINPRNGQLYFLTKESQKSSSTYRLRTLKYQGALLVSATEIQPLDAWFETQDELSALEPIPAEKTIAKR